MVLSTVDCVDSGADNAFKVPLDVEHTSIASPTDAHDTALEWMNMFVSLLLERGRLVAFLSLLKPNDSNDPPSSSADPEQYAMETLKKMRYRINHEQVEPFFFNPNANEGFHGLTSLLTTLRKADIDEYNLRPD